MAWPLMREHGYLGASLEDGRVASYLNETPLDEALQGACVYDLTGSLYRFVSGEDAQGFMETLCAGTRLPAGSSAFSAVLTGDGALVSVPFIVRGGASEYMVIDPGRRRAMLDAWMGFARSIEQDGVMPFEQASIEDASSLLVPLLVCGTRARELLGDYTADAVLPGPGCVASVAFDGVPCVLAALDERLGDAFIVFAPPAFSVRLFRSFLSFTYAHPQGMASLERFMGRLPWQGQLAGDDRVIVGRDALSAWGIVRPDAGFIGSRGL